MSVALEHYLQPLQPFLQEDGVTEICMNKAQELYVEKAGKFTHHHVATLERGFLQTLAELVAEYNQKDSSLPLLAGSLPRGERIQWVMNPACAGNQFIFSIRRHQMREMTLEKYQEAGVFNEITHPTTLPSIDNQLKDLYRRKNILRFIKLAIAAKKNILISGGTGTGKTTFLNACLKLIPDHERLITIEDTREVAVSQPNAVHLLFDENHPHMNALNMFKVCLRLRPDRIFLSELRGSEVWPYLRAANSGHPGSLSTVHADTPDAAFTQLVFMMQQAGSTSSEERIRNYIKSIIHIVIQLKKSSHTDRFMTVSDIYFNEVH